MDALLLLLFLVAACAVIIALALTAWGFLVALMWCLRWLLNKVNGKNNYDPPREDGDRDGPVH